MQYKIQVIPLMFPTHRDARNHIQNGFNIKLHLIMEDYHIILNTQAGDWRNDSSEQDRVRIEGSACTLLSLTVLDHVRSGVSVQGTNPIVFACFSSIPCSDTKKRKTNRAQQRELHKNTCNALKLNFWYDIPHN